MGGSDMPQYISYIPLYWYIRSGEVGSPPKTTSDQPTDESPMPITLASRWITE